MKSFKIEKTEKNWNWCYENLMPEDYEVQGNEIVIFYRYDFHKKDILDALNDDNYGN